MLKIYNTLTRNKEDFKPIREGKVSMYSCGPTVYNYAHIGNLRTYIFMDIFRRVLRYDGYKIKGVMNITDVGHLMSDADDGEDKMAKASREQKKTPLEIAQFYTSVFFEDLSKLNIGRPEVIAKATEHIQDMISYVSQLVDKGYGYEIDDGIYFDISKFEGYGKLSRLNLEEQQAGARVEVNSQKRHPADFALWKKAEPGHIMQWDSPWGRGYPGWHIECSAMSRKYLGMPFDVHTGGVDHIPVHHENEIAQNEALTGKQSVNYWVHGEFMLVDNGKMSKSLGNTYRISDLEDRGYRALDFRYFCLNTHYRKKLNFTFEGLDAAKSAYVRLLSLLFKHKSSNVATDKDLLESYEKDFEEAIDDDLNIPLALGVLWKMIKENKSKDIYELALKFDKVLGLSLDTAACDEEEPREDIPAEIVELCERRKAAKANKDYAGADALRSEIAAQGYTVVDTKDGYKVTKA
ncbi:MAG: cysteine--tRNA ligase [Clostridia bacterium]|nr:cysteine--tRNA ligase [Clostridia bacterium]